MNKVLFSLVSYFICLLFFVSSSEAATFVVNNPANDNSSGTLAWAVGQVNAAGAGPHTISITSNTGFWGSPVTITANDVTITGNVAACGDPLYVVDWAAASIIIAGNNCVVKGLIFRSASLVLQGSNNRVWGCWFNMDATGTAAQGNNPNNGAAVYVNGGANNTIGLGSQCRNVFSGANMNNMILVDGTATNTIISSNYLGVAKNGTTVLGTTSSNNGVYFLSGTANTSRVDSNIIAGTGTGILVAASANNLNIRANDIYNLRLNGIKIESSGTLNGLTITNNKIRSISGTGADPTDEGDGFGIKLRDINSDVTTLQGNLIGVQASGAVGTASPDLGCFKNGIYARANIAALTINDNVICDNGNAETGREVCSGLFVFTSGNNFGAVNITNNYVGVDKSGGKRGNDFAGINVRYFSSGTLGSLLVQSNIVGDNGANAGPSPQNPNPDRRSHGIAIQGYYASSAANFKIDNNYVGVFPGTFANVGNHANGIELYDCRNFIVGEPGLGNVIGFNKFETSASGFTGAGLMINGASQNGTIQSNYIGVGPGGQVIGNTNPVNLTPSLVNTNSGITIEQSTSITIGGAAANQANTIKNNNIGIQIAKVGAVNSSSNTITGNTVSSNTTSGILISGGNSNTFTRNSIASNGSYGIYITSGTGNTIGDATNAANGNIVTLNGADGIQVTNTTSINNRITRNQISCNTGQGIKLNYGASAGNNGQQPPVIASTTGAVVSGTATAGATIEIFMDDIACQIACGTSVNDNRREGKTYLGTVVANGTGNWTYTHGSTLDANNISATATVGSNTSEFSICSLCPTANAGTSQSLACDVTSATLAATAAATGETGTWTVVPANPAITFNDIHSNTATVSNLPAGVTTLRWTISKLGCPDDFKDITITVKVSITATASASATSVCSTSPNVTLTGSNPSPGTGLWTVVGGAATLTNATSYNTASAAITTSPATFRWTTTNGTCTSFANTSAVTVTTAVTATASVNTTSVCSTSPNVTLTGNNPAPGTGLWTVTGGAATLTNATSYNTATAAITTSPATFTWTTTNGPCTSSASTSAVTVTTAVTATASASTTTVCSTSPNVTLTGNNPAPGTGAWTVVGGAATLTNATSYNTASAAITTSPATFRWTTTNGPCSSFANTSAVTVTTAVTATASVNTTSVCSSSPNVTLTGNNPAPGTGLWTVTGGTATLTNATSYNTATASITSGPATFTWTTTNGPCTSSASTSAVTVTTPVTASATATSNVCSSSPLIVLVGNNPSPGTGAWTVTGGTATFGNASNASTTATVTSGTSLTFTWTTTNGACVTSANATTTVSAPVTATASSNKSAVCTSSPVVTLTGSNPSPGTGLWTVTGGTATYDNATNTVATATITSGTSLTFTWTITNGACSTSASTSIITVSNPVNPVNAAATSSVCSSSPVVSLTGSNPSPGTGLWTVAGGTVNFGNATQEATSATVTSGTSLTFTWTVTNGPCITTATATTTVNAAVTSNAGPAQALCNITTAALQGNNPSVGTGAWTVSSGTGSVTSPSIFNSGVTGLTIGGASTFVWTVTNGSCVATSSVTITVSAPGSISAGADQSVCQTNVGTVTLVGTGTGTWTTVTGSGAASSPTSSSTAVTGLTVGATTTFRWTVTSGACSGTDDVNVTVDATPVGSAGSNQALCNSTVANLSATGSGSWTTVSGTGVVTSPTANNTGVTGLTVGGSSTFRWTLVNGACSVPLDINVTSSSPVTANGGSDVKVCNSTTANLSATGTGAWTASATIGTGTVTTPSDPSSGVTGLTVGTSSVFRWIVTSGACADTNLVTVTSYSPAVASAGLDKSLCNTTTYTMTATGTGEWLVPTLSGTGVITTPASPTSGVTGLTVGGTSVFVWKVTNGTCQATDSVTLSVSPGTTADAGSAQTLCNTNNATLNATAGTNGTWLASTDATIDNLTDPHSTVTVINSPATLTWQIDGGGCGNATATVTLTKVTLAKPVISGTGSQACSGSTYAYTITNIDVSATYNWSSTSSAINVNPSTGTAVDVSATSSGKVFVFVSNSGCSDSASAVITVLPPLPTGRDTLKLATCIPVGYKIKTSLYDDFTGTWSSHNGGITFNFNPADSTTSIVGLVDGVTDTLTYTISNVCGSLEFIYVIKVGGVFSDLEASGPSDTLCVTNARHLNALVTPAGNYTYYWVSNVNYNNPVIDASVHIDSTTVPTYSIRPRGRNNIYFVYVVDKVSQCRTNIDTAYIHAVEGQDLYVPNLITPNEDNMNDHWVLRDKTTGQEILPGSHFELYNRWGQRVFMMDNYDNRFKADHISDGIYYFNVKSGCGDKEYKGWLQILGNTNP